MCNTGEKQYYIGWVCKKITSACDKTTLYGCNNSTTAVNKSSSDSTKYTWDCAINWDVVEYGCSKCKDGFTLHNGSCAKLNTPKKYSICYWKWISPDSMDFRVRSLGGDVNLDENLELPLKVVVSRKSTYPPYNTTNNFYWISFPWNCELWKTWFYRCDHIEFDSTVGSFGVVFNDPDYEWTDFWPDTITRNGDIYYISDKSCGIPNDPKCTQTWKPTNSHYVNTDAPWPWNCDWECDDGYTKSWNRCTSSVVAKCWTATQFATLDKPTNNLCSVWSLSWNITEHQNSSWFFYRQWTCENWWNTTLCSVNIPTAVFTATPAWRNWNPKIKFNVSTQPYQPDNKKFDGTVLRVNIITGTCINNFNWRIYTEEGFYDIPYNAWNDGLFENRSHPGVSWSFCWEWSSVWSFDNIKVSMARYNGKDNVNWYKLTAWM